MSATTTIARAFPIEGAPPRTYPAGRHCERDGCGTLLYIYNARRRCRAHAGGRPIVGAGVRAREGLKEGDE